VGHHRLFVFGAVLLGLAAGCPFSFTNEDHCAALDGDATCAAADPSRPYCALDNCGEYNEVTNRTGCVAAVPEKLECYSPCGGKQDANARSVCGGDTETTTAVDTDPSSGSSTSATDGPSGSSTTGDGPCDDDAPNLVGDECLACADNGECDGWFGDDRAFCVEPECVACLPSLQGDLPHHRGCSSAEALPNCIDDVCEPACRFPEECPDTGCSMREGVCGPSDVVFYVDPTNGTMGATGSLEDPLNTISAAVAMIGAEAKGADFRLGTIMLEPGTYTENVAIESRTVIIRPADPDDPPEFVSDDAVPVFDLLDGDAGSGEPGLLNIVGVRFSGVGGPIVRVGRTARFHGDNLEVVGMSSVIQIDNGRAFLRNSVVSGTTGTPFVYQNPGELSIISSTIVQSGDNVVFDCLADEGAPNLLVRDSIVGNVGNMPESNIYADACVEQEVRSVVGDIGPASSFKNDGSYRLETMPDAVLQVDAPEFCERDEFPDMSDFPAPCAPNLDIDGKNRRPADGDSDPVFWPGASVP